MFSGWKKGGIIGKICYSFGQRGNNLTVTVNRARVNNIYLAAWLLPGCIQ